MRAPAKSFQICLFFSFSLSAGSSFAQRPIDELIAAERVFIRQAAERGQKLAFLEHLAESGIVFKPDAINGKQFWNLTTETSPSFQLRKNAFADVSSNGFVGYTTGSWELFRKQRTETPDASGQYVTIWEKRPDGRFWITLDLTIKHESFSDGDVKKAKNTLPIQDNNKKRYSAADAAMNFLRSGMGNKALGDAYARFSAPGVRLLREGLPPIIGKNAVVDQTRDYTSMRFPIRLGLLESSDMAYFWNPCEYINSDEGREKGNCLHIWKLRKKNWYIVLGVFARVENNTPPVLKLVDPRKIRSN